MGKKIYEEGHMAAKKAPCERKYVTAGKKVEVEWNSSNGNTDISQCIGLLGQIVSVNVPSDICTMKKKAQIIMLYPHMALAVYKSGKENEHEFKIGISVAELVEKGLLSFAKGYPEVIE